MHQSIEFLKSIAFGFAKLSVYLFLLMLPCFAEGKDQPQVGVDRLLPTNIELINKRLEQMATLTLSNKDVEKPLNYGRLATLYARLKGDLAWASELRSFMQIIQEILCAPFITPYSSFAPIFRLLLSAVAKK